MWNIPESEAPFEDRCSKLPLIRLRELMYFSTSFRSFWISGVLMSRAGPCLFVEVGVGVFGLGAVSGSCANAIGAKRKTKAAVRSFFIKGMIRESVDLIKTKNPDRTGGIFCSRRKAAFVAAL